MVDDLGYRCFGSIDGYNEKYGADKEREIDEAVDRLVRKAHDLAEQTLKANYDRFDALAKALIDHEVVEGEEMDTLLS